MTEKRVVGMFIRAQAIVNQPEALDFLAEHAGLNLVHLFDAPVKLSPEVQKLHPAYANPQARGRIWGSAQDDTVLRKAIDIAHGKGLPVWVGGQGLQGPGRLAPEHIVRDLLGQRMDQIEPPRYALEFQAQMLCPSDEAVNRWFEAAYVDLFRQYPVEGMYISHFRYQHPSFWPTVWGCGCENCACRAEELGYNFPAMKRAALEVRKRLVNLKADEVRKVIKFNLSFYDLLELLGGERAFLDWLDFRAKALSDNMARYRQAIHQALGREVSFCVQGAVPTFALLTGHQYLDLATSCDVVSPINQHIGSLFLVNFVSLAYELCRWAPGLSESEALEALYMLFGYGDLPLPRSIERLGGPQFLANMEERVSGQERRQVPEEELDFAKLETEIGCLPQILEREIVKSRLFAGPEMVSYPLLKGGGWPRSIVQYAMGTAYEAGHQGILFQGHRGLIPAELWDESRPGAVWP